MAPPSAPPRNSYGCAGEFPKQVELSSHKKASQAGPGSEPSAAHGCMRGGVRTFAETEGAPQFTPVPRSVSSSIAELTIADLISGASPIAVAADSRWLLSCKFDKRRTVGKVAALVERLLGEDVVSNPNRFTKSCCTVGEEWDDDYNQGKNEEKYLRCWEPNAPPHLQCTKQPLPGQEPSEKTCWKSSYFWRLKKCGKMLRIVEDGHLGEGQIIEKAMADFLGAEVIVLHVSGIQAQLDDEGDWIGNDSITSWDIQQVSLWTIACKIEEVLWRAGFIVKSEALHAMKPAQPKLWIEGPCGARYDVCLPPGRRAEALRDSSPLISAVKVWME